LPPLPPPPRMRRALHPRAPGQPQKLPLLPSRARGAAAADAAAPSDQTSQRIAGPCAPRCLRWRHSPRARAPRRFHRQTTAVWVDREWGEQAPDPPVRPVRPSDPELAKPRARAPRRRACMRALIPRARPRPSCRRRRQPRAAGPRPGPAQQQGVIEAAPSWPIFTGSRHRSGALRSWSRAQR